MVPNTICCTRTPVMGGSGAQLRLRKRPRTVPPACGGWLDAHADCTRNQRCNFHRRECQIACTDMARA
eukprot:8414998-Alexandrium_andersonii.AAC.1